MQPRPLDTDFWLRVNQAVIWAQVKGLDQAEYLNKQGLVLSPEQDKRIRLEAMNYLLTQLNNWRPAEFLRRRHLDEPASPADMYRCIVGFIEEHIEWWEREQ